MNLTVEIPDDVVGQLKASGGDLSPGLWRHSRWRNTRTAHLTEDELRRMLGFGTRYQLDGFLKSHDVWMDYTLEDFCREVDSLKQLGL